MKNVIDDNVRRQLLDELSEESTMVLSTAYAYAKNYVLYGEDITKLWTTAVQQASILEQVKVKAWAEGYDSLRKDYKNRLKADMSAMIKKIQSEIEEKSFYDTRIIGNYEDEVRTYLVELDDVNGIIQQKINLLKSESEERK